MRRLVEVFAGTLLVLGAVCFVPPLAKAQYGTPCWTNCYVCFYGPSSCFFTGSCNAGICGGRCATGCSALGTPGCQCRAVYT